MTDQGFRDFLAAHVVLEDEPAPLPSEDADRAVAGAFDTFDRVCTRGGHYKPKFKDQYRLLRALFLLPFCLAFLSRQFSFIAASTLLVGVSKVSP